MDLDFDNEAVAQVRLAMSALAGGVIYHAIRPAATWAKVATRTVACVLAGFIFTEPAMLFFDIPDAYTGAVGAGIGLGGLSIASGVLRAIERFDFAALFKGGVK